MPALTRQPLEWNDRAPVRIVRTKRIPAPPETVWAAIADHENWPKWFTQLKSVTPGATADGVGGTRSVDAGFATFDEEFLAWEPGKRFAFAVTHSTRPGMKTLNEDVTLTAAGDDATTITYVQAADVVARPLLGPVMRRMLGKGLDSALENLERQLRS